MKTTSKRIVRHRRVRAKVSGTAGVPRLAVFRSNKNLYVQLIDDNKEMTIFGIKSKGKNIAAAKELGIEVAKKSNALKISKIVFDRGGFRYHGAIKALADAARDGGLKF